jgi:hypothetical protein
MLERLSTTLKLDSQEREFLFALAQHRPPPLVFSGDEVIRQSTQHLMDSLSLPAQVITDDWTVIGWNRLVTRVFRDYSNLPPRDRNLLRILLLNDRYKADEERYRGMVKRLAARFKWDYSRTTRVEVFDELIEEMLRQSPMFAEYWHESDIVGHFEDIHTANVPGIGQITLQHTSYAIEEAPGQRLMLFAPVDAESAARLDEVANKAD